MKLRFRGKGMYIKNQSVSLPDEFMHNFHGYIITVSRDEWWQSQGLKRYNASCMASDGGIVLRGEWYYSMREAVEDVFSRLENRKDIMECDMKGVID